MPVFPTFEQVYQGFAEQIGKLPGVAPRVEMPADQRVKRAVKALIDETHADEAVWLESCVHCGQCVDACHFYESTQDSKYAPLRKIRLYQRVYRQEVGPFRWLYKLVGRPVTVEDLEELQELVYDSCTECGRCTMICPMGIDIASLVHHCRTALVAAGMAPPEMAAVTFEQKQMRTVFGASPDVLRSLVQKILDEYGEEIPIDKDKAEVLVLTSAVDIVMNGNGLLATARVMNHLGVDWTLRTDAYESANFGLLAGDMDLMVELADNIAKSAERVGAKVVIVAECGHAYSALRWNPHVHGKELPFEILYMSEFLGRQVQAGKLRLEPLNRTVTFHDPCKIGRRGGAFDEPRAVLAAMNAELVEMPANREVNWCCGGGAGVFLLNRATELRDKAFKIKLGQVDATGADGVVVSCASCRLNFEAGRFKNRWDKQVDSLVELVADHLKDGEAGQPAAVAGGEQ